MLVAIRNFVDPKVNGEAKKRLFVYQLRCSLKTESRDQSFETKTETCGQDQDRDLWPRPRPKPGVPRPGPRPRLQFSGLETVSRSRRRSRDHITDLTISESEDLNSDLEEEDLDLPLWDLTTSLMPRVTVFWVYLLHYLIHVNIAQFLHLKC